jgi:7-cyano-7-deazaguanine synthase
MKAVTLLSGGLDSTTLAYHLISEYSDREGDDDHIIPGSFELIALSFDYGQRHSKELEVAQKIAERIGAEWHVIDIGVSESLDDDLDTFASILAASGSVLVDPTKDVPDGHYAEDNMKQTVVPNRNAIMLSIAYAVALAHKADVVAFAAHSGDHRIYPDCRPEFVEALSDTLRLGAAWKEDELSSLPEIKGPFLFRDKAWIAKQAEELGVPIAETWSCYKGGDIHCGTCGTCYERREAFQLAGVEDPTEYLDNTTVFAAPG